MQKIEEVVVVAVRTRLKGFLLGKKVCHIYETSLKRPSVIRHSCTKNIEGLCHGLGALPCPHTHLR